jgi:HK97 family phage prohead protease
MTTNEEITQVRSVERTYTLQDMHVRSDGGGRIVEAYAAVFDTQTEVMDQDGHYNEAVNKAAFTRTLQHKGTNFGVLFNHGRTIDGEPNPAATMPIGVPLVVRADETGLYTETRYLDNPLADWTLDAIKQGAIKAQSFSGRFRRSIRSYPQGRSAGQLPLITRNEIEMREYGPAVFAAYTGAAILGTRSATDLFVRSLLAIPAGEKRLEWLQQFEGLDTLLTGDAEALPLGTPNGLAEQTASDARKHSARSVQMRERITAYRAKTNPKG